MADADAVARVIHAERSRGYRFARKLGLESAGRILRDFATYLPTKAVPAVAGFLVLPVLGRQLDRNSLGVLGIMTTLVPLGWTATGNWCTAAIMRELPAAAATGSMRSFRRTLNRSLGLIVALLTLYTLVLALGGLTSRALSHNFALVVAATAGLVLQNIAVTLFAASLRPRAYAVIEVAARIGGIGLGVVLVLKGHGVGGYLAGLAIGSTLIGAVGLAFAWPRTATGVREPAAAATDRPLRRWLNYGVPLSVAALLGWALAFADRYILAALKSWDAAGVYFVGNSIGDKLVMVPMAALTMAAYPLLVTAFESLGRGEVERLLRAYTRVVLLVSIPCVALLYAAAGPLVIAVTGQYYTRYGEAATIAPIVAIGSVLFGLAGLAAVGLAVQRQTRYLALTSAIAVVVNVVANLALIPSFGVVGAAIATPISNVAFLAATVWWSRAYATWRFPVATLLRTVVAGAAAVVVARLAVHQFHWQVAQVLAAIGAGLPTYGLLLVALGELGRRRGVASANMLQP